MEKLPCLEPWRGCSPEAHIRVVYRGTFEFATTNTYGAAGKLTAVEFNREKGSGPVLSVIFSGATPYGWACQQKGGQRE